MGKSIGVHRGGLVTFCLLALMGCAKSRERVVAPQSSKDVGWIVYGASPKEIENFLDQHSDTEYRKVSEKHHLYEVFNSDGETLKKEFPRSIVEPNKWTRFIPTRLEAAANGGIEKVFGETQSDSDGKEKLPNCVESPVKPKAIPEVVFADATRKPITIGTKVQLSGKKSSPNPRAVSKLTKAWGVVPPDGSLIKQYSVIGSSDLEYTPDVMGRHTIVLLVQDERHVCDYTEISIEVTGNEKWQPLAAKTLADLGTSLDIFTHLKMLEIPKVWSMSQGEGVVMAILDSGMNYLHPALNGALGFNTKEIPDNGKDDDGNGLVDDAYGYDFVFQDGYAFDDEGHGSHVAGLAASPLIGVAPKAKVLPLKVLGPGGGGDHATIAAALLYANDQKVKIANLSLGSYGSFNPFLMSVMDHLEADGLLVIAAAGNGSNSTGRSINVDVTPHYPASYPQDNIVSVAASDTQGVLAPYSNFGVNSVDVLAPGGMSPKDDLVSAYMQNPKGILFYGMAGTSMATPIVAGIAANAMSANPNLNYQKVKDILLSSGKEDLQLQRIVKSGRLINAVEVVKKAQDLR